MRTPESLSALVDDGIIDEVVRPLMSGKEAQIYLVVSGGEQRVAKIYKDAQNRSFQNRADYTEGRSVRNSRDQRAMGNRSRHGRAQNEAAWKTAEVDMIYRLRAAGVRVPTPYNFVDGVLIMELVTDAEGFPAPRLGDLDLEAEHASEVFERLLREVVRMLSAGVVHGDLSDFNVLMSADGPVVIDFPQAVDAASNQNARKLLLRDVANLHRFHSKFNADKPALPYAEEMWELYQRSALTPDTRLLGRFHKATKPVRTEAVLDLISDADKDERRKRERLGLSLRGTSEPRPYTAQGHNGAGQGRDARPQQGRDNRPQQSRNNGPVQSSDPRGVQGRDNRALPGRDDRPQQARDNRALPNRDDRPQQARDNRALPTREDRPQQTRDNRALPNRDDRPQHARDNRALPNREARPQQARDNRALPNRDDRPQQSRDNRALPNREDRPQQSRDNRALPGRDDRPQHARDVRPQQGREDRFQRRDDRPQQRHEDRPQQSRDSGAPQSRDSRPQQGNENRSFRGSDSRPQPRGNDSGAQRATESRPQEGHDSRTLRGGDSRSQPSHDSRPRQGRDNSRPAFDQSTRKRP